MTLGCVSEYQVAGIQSAILLCCTTLQRRLQLQVPSELKCDTAFLVTQELNASPLCTAYISNKRLVVVFGIASGASRSPRLMHDDGTEIEMILML